MKRILLLMILSCFTAVGFAQVLVDGDYRTAKLTGNWSDADVWEKRTGGTWSVTATAPTASNNVYVQAGHTVTVDVANVYVKDLQLNTAGFLKIEGNVVNVSGKIRAFTNPAVTGSADGNYSTSTTVLSSSMIITSGAGVLKFVGGSRTIAAANEWGSATTTNAVEFALDANAVGNVVTGVKFRPILISSGYITTDGLFSPGSGDFTIKNGATFRSTRGTSVIWNSSTAKAGTLTIEAGATLDVSGSKPTIDVTAINNNGTIIYSGAAQSFITKSTTNLDNAVLFPSYQDLKLSGSGTKQMPSVDITVSNSLVVEGTAAISNTEFVKKIIMADKSTIFRNGTGSITSTVFQFGVSPADLINLSVGAVVSTAGELISSPNPGSIGSLTITPSGNYTIVTSRAVGNLINNGILTFSPAAGNTVSFTVGGNISGAGTITGNTEANLSLASSNDGEGGVLRFTSGFENLRVLTINRTGINPSYTLGSNLTLSNNLSLTSGLLNILPGQIFTISGANSVSGTSFSSVKYVNLQNQDALVAKFVVTDLASSKLFPVGNDGNYLPITLNPTAASNFELNVFSGATTDATPNGTALTAAQKLKMVDAVWNINRTSGTGDVTVTLGWDAALEGTDFANFTNSNIGVAGYNAGAYGTFTGPGSATNNNISFTTSTFSPFIVGQANTTLPLTLLSFEARERLNSVLLTWQTTDEVNLKHYVLQHKVGNDFVAIQTVPANNKVGVFNYSYTHLNPSVGVNYYRLVGVDFDGTAHPSKDKWVNVAAANAVTVYPNPVANRNVSVSGVVKGDIIKLLNIQGQVILTKAANGNQIEEIDVQNIQAGTYILSIENSGKITSTKKVIKI